MPDLTPNHPAVEAGAQQLSDVKSGADDALWAAMDAYLEADPEDAKVSRERMSAALAAARERYTADDLRDTPGGRDLKAEGWDEGSAMGSAFRRSTADTFPSNPYREDNA